MVPHLVIVLVADAQLGNKVVVPAFPKQAQRLVHVVALAHCCELERTQRGDSSCTRVQAVVTQEVISLFLLGQPHGVVALRLRHSLTPCSANVWLTTTPDTVLTLKTYEAMGSKDFRTGRLEHAAGTS